VADLVDLYVTEAGFAAPARRLADVLAGAGGRVFLYR
jgi:hypothetical protein